MFAVEVCPVITFLAVTFVCGRSISKRTTADNGMFLILTWIAFALVCTFPSVPIVTTVPLIANTAKVVIT